MKIISISILIALCIGSALTVLPIIDRNVNDPNLIVYFNHDEGYLMDLVWLYYSGETRPSFQYDGDYGLEMRYLSDLSNAFLRKFINFSPGTFVLILRWFHLLAWLFALVLLWRFVYYHFGKVWQAAMTVLLVGTYPAFASFTGNLKPEPLMLVFIILGLDYSLRMLEGAHWKNLIFSIVCAVCAYLIKFAGLFLLPVILMSMYMLPRIQKERNRVFPMIRLAWLLPAMVGFIITMPALAIIFFYKRRTSGLTWFEQFGFFESLSQNRVIVFIVVASLGLVMASVFLWIFNKARSGPARQIIAIINEINSYAIILIILFAVFLGVFGFYWVSNPSHFLAILAQNGRDALSAGSGRPMPYMVNAAQKVIAFNPFVFVFFIFYCVMEIIKFRENFTYDRIGLGKRVALFMFLPPFFLYMFSGARAVQHHMLPFFAVALILGFQALEMIFLRIKPRRTRIALFGLLLAMMFFVMVPNCFTSLRLLTARYNQKDDVVFDIIKWWRISAYSVDTPIVADHPVLAYMPSEYKNVTFLNHRDDRVEQIKRMVPVLRPKLLYLNIGIYNGSIMPPMQSILPGITVKEAAIFDNKGKLYRRHPRGQYAIYELHY